MGKHGVIIVTVQSPAVVALIIVLLPVIMHVNRVLLQEAVRKTERHVQNTKLINVTLMAKIIAILQVVQSLVVEEVTHLLGVVAAGNVKLPSHQASWGLIIVVYVIDCTCIGWLTDQAIKPLAL